MTNETVLTLRRFAGNFREPRRQVYSSGKEVAEVGWYAMRPRKWLEGADSRCEIFSRKEG